MDHDAGMIGWRQVLVPVRGGPDATVRAQLALRLAASTGATATFLYVLDDRLLGDPDAGLVREQLHKQLTQEGEAVLAGIGRLEEAQGITYLTRIASGKVVETIVRVAQEIGADLIVVGSHRQTWLGRLVGGSVAEMVLRAASCTVLAVPPAAGLGRR